MTTMPLLGCSTMLLADLIVHSTCYHEGRLQPAATLRIALKESLAKRFCKSLITGYDIAARGVAGRETAYTSYLQRQTLL